MNDLFKTSVFLKLTNESDKKLSLTLLLLGNSGNYKLREVRTILDIVKVKIALIR